MHRYVGVVSDEIVMNEDLEASGCQMEIGVADSQTVFLSFKNSLTAIKYS
jgi:hypothetical protein